MNKVLTGALVGGLTIAGSVIAIAPSAAAGENNSAVNCESYVVDYSGFDTEDNRFVLTIDDVVVFDEMFDDSIRKVVGFDNTVPHEIKEELFIDGASQGEGWSETTPCTDPIPVRPETPKRATDCTDPLSQIVLPTTEGVSYAIDEEEGKLVATAEEPYFFAEEDFDWFLGSSWAGTFPGDRVTMNLDFLVPSSCADEIEVVSVSAVCDAGVPYVQYSVDAPWAEYLDLEFATADLTAETFHYNWNMRSHLPLEGKTPWPTWTPKDDPQGGPDSEYLPPTGETPWDGKAIDVYFHGMHLEPAFRSGGVYADSALEYPCDESADDAEADAEGPVLAATGATVGGAAAFAVLLVAAGGVFIWLRRRALKS